MTHISLELDKFQSSAIERDDVELLARLVRLVRLRRGQDVR